MQIGQPVRTIIVEPLELPLKPPIDEREPKSIHLLEPAPEKEPLSK